MSESTTVRCYFDFVSPYSWLALSQARTFADEHGVRWDLRPVVYAVLLDTTGLIGPAEVEVKRRYTFLDVARCAAHFGLRLVGPPEHPFRSLEALRTICLYRDDPRAMALAIGLANACWSDGRSLTDPQVLAGVVRDVGLDATDLEQRIAAPEIKQALRDSTADALAQGVFGVPSFVLAGEIFWGHDRLPYLAERLAGVHPPLREATERVLARPRGAQRRGRRR